MRGAGAQAEAVPTDVADEAGVQRLAQRAVDPFGRTDVWVNKAGVMIYGITARAAAMPLTVSGGACATPRLALAPTSAANVVDRTQNGTQGTIGCGL